MVRAWRSTTERGKPAQIDGTVAGRVAVEIDSRTAKQVRGACIGPLVSHVPQEASIDPARAHVQCRNHGAPVSNNSPEVFVGKRLSRSGAPWPWFEPKADRRCEPSEVGPAAAWFGEVIAYALGQHPAGSLPCDVAAKRVP